jgi:transcription initiation factor TFIIIB Brf1 subunit/transcription initiation factor TFIIB
MTKQTDINAKMRAILIDWLVEVHLKFKLMPETLYLTVNLIDRFLEKETIARNKLQLVGVTAMFIASKYEEIYAPECRDFVYISDKAYTREQILQMEGLMLSKLNFQLTTPNALVFLKRFAKVGGILATPRTKTELLSNYLVELTLQEDKMLKYLPSTIAAAATYLALKTMGNTPWTPELTQHACYTEAAILPCVRDINALHKNAAANNLQAVRKKYAQEKHGSVSGIPAASI